MNKNKGKKVREIEYWKYILAKDKHGNIGVVEGYFDSKNNLTMYTQEFDTICIPPWEEDNPVEIILQTLDMIKSDIQKDKRILNLKEGRSKCLITFNQTRLPK